MEETRKFTPLVLEIVIKGDPERVEDMVEKVHMRVRDFLVYFETVDGMEVTGRINEV